MSEEQSKIIPNTHQTPNALTDDFMRYLDGDEVKCYLAVTRKTLGWLKRTDRIATSQLVEMTGLSDKRIAACMRSLVEFGLVVRVAENDPRKNHGVEWALQMDDTKINTQAMQARSKEQAQANAERAAKAREKKAQGGGVVTQPQVVAQPPGGVVTQPTQKPLSKAINKERETRTLSQSDFYGMTVKDAQTIPELQTFREATQTWPGVGQWWLIYERIRADGLTVEQVRAVYEQWCGRGYNPANIDYLLYAKEGKIPDRKKKVTYGNSSANWTSEPAPQYTDADRVLAEQIKRKRTAAPAPV